MDSKEISLIATDINRLYTFLSRTLQTLDNNVTGFVYMRTGNYVRLIGMLI